MSDNLNPQPDLVYPLIYQIRLKGHRDCGWADWFGGLTISLEDNGETLITGPVRDQAALYGLLKKVRNLGLPLISVNSIEPGQAKASADTSSNPQELFTEEGAKQ
jgi:hypothetical protein